MVVITEPNATVPENWYNGGNALAWIYPVYDENAIAKTMVVPTVLLTLLVVGLLYGLCTRCYCPCVTQCPCRRRRLYESGAFSRWAAVVTAPKRD